jgi:uncharacterized membrane protein YhaH (DUF805 family)
MKQLVTVARLGFGAWMLASGINHFFFPLWSMPAGNEPLAVQLMAAFVHSGLLNVAMAIQMVAGALILAGLFVPVALCVVMPVSTCALYWSLILDHRPLGAGLALAAFALNGLLMLAYIDFYKGVLQRRALTLGEESGGRLVYDLLFASPNGRTTRGEFIPALLTLLAAATFYTFLVTGRTAQWCTLVLLIPATFLLSRRLHDMGHTAWLLLVPVVLMVAAFAIWLEVLKPGAPLKATVPLLALAVSAGVAIWCCIGKGQAEANRFGAAAAA